MREEGSTPRSFLAALLRMTENQVLLFAQDDKAVVILRAVSPPEGSRVGVGCHSEGRRPEESGVKAFQKQNQVLHSVQNDNQNQVLRRRSGRQKNPVILRPGSWPKNLVVDRSIIRNAIPHAQLVQDENVYSSNPGFFLPKK